MLHEPPPAPTYESRTSLSSALSLFIPIVAIVALLLCASLYVISRSASQIDAIQADTERTLAKTAFATTVDPIVRSIQDYSFWDDTYDQTRGAIDLDWTKDNLGPYLAKTYGVTHLFIFDAKGQMRYASIPSADEQIQLTSSQAPELEGQLTDVLRAAASAALKSALGGKFDGVQGYISHQDSPAFLAARAIRPDSVERHSKDLPVTAMVMLKVIDDETLKGMSKAFGLANLRLSENYRISLPMVGQETAAFGPSWTSRGIGEQFASDATWVLLQIGAIAVVLIALSAAGWLRAFGNVKDAEMKALAERAKSVQDTARAKSLFVANMSHELRTPLNAIIGFSELIKEQILGAIGNPKYAEYANDIHASGKHLLGIVNNILTLSKIEAQQQRVVIEDVSVAAAVSEAMRMAMPDAAKRKIAIHSDLADVPLARADAQALTQIVVNLLSNAAKFSAPGDSVLVRTSCGDGNASVVLTVTDRGCGIPEETLAQLGRPFTQAEDPFRRNYQGTGLGLSICFALARAMNGELRIDSEIDKGTIATLELPSVAIASDASTPEPRAA